MPTGEDFDRALLGSPATLEAIYQSAPVGLCVLDRELRYVRINDFLARMNGRPAADHIGRTVREVVPVVADAVERIAAQVFRTGEAAFATEGSGVDTEHPERPGVWRASWYPIKNAAGAVIGLNAMVEDVTEHRRAGEQFQQLLGTLETRVAARTAELAESERKYRLLAENTRDILFRLDREGLLQYVGPQIATYGLDPARIIGTHFLAYVHPDDRERTVAQFHASLIQDDDHSLVVRLLTPALGTRWFEERDQVQKDADGRAIGVTGILRDITENRRAAQALEESEEKYRKLFEAETNCIILMDAATRQIVDVNEAALRTYGYTREEFLALTVDQVSAEPSDSDALIARATEDGQAEAPVRWHRRKDGSRFPIETRVTRYTWRGRDILCGISHDITAALARDQERQRVVEALRDSEEKYRKLFELESGGIVLAEVATGRIVDVNEAALRIYGYSREEFMALRAQDFSAEPDATGAFVARLQADGYASASPRWHRRKDGARIPLDLHAVLITLRGTKVMFAVVRDIADRLAKDQALRESEEKYRKLFELETDGVIFIDMESRGVIDVNDAALELYGYSREEFMKVDVRKITAEPEATEALVSRLRQHGAASAPVRWHRRQDGTLVPVEVHAVLFTLRERPVTFLVVRDISEQLAQDQEMQRAVAALRESEEKYRKLFETETDLIVLLDAETGRILDANDAAVRSYGYSREEFLALGVDQYSGEPDASRDFLSRVGLFGTAQASVRWHRRKDGTRFPLQIHATRFTWRGREIICGVGRDISEQLAREEENRRQSAALGRLAQEVSAAAERERRRIAAALHDNLVQMLVSCQVRIDQILLEPRPRQLKPTLRRVVEILDGAVKDARDLTFQLAPPALEGLGLAAALEQLCRDLGREFGIPFDFHESGSPVALGMDRRQVMFRCVRELMVNAGRHAKARRVTVTLEHAPDGVTAAVADDGQGFDARQAGFDFDTEGGFGLFSARQQLLNAGASLAIHSTPGQGTRVVIVLPLPRPEGAGP